MTNVLDRLNDFLAVVVAIILVLMTLTIGYAIFARAVHLPGPVWIVQFNEYAMLWATFLGAAWLLSKKRHVSIELIVSRLSRGTQKVFHLLHSLLGMSLCAILGWYGALTTLENFQRGVINVQAVDVPMGYVLLVIPFGFLLLLLQFVHDFFRAAHALLNPLAPDPLGPKAPGEEHEGGGH
jgi:TRAP-type C4-dicarboxylate transport system permease small subunit